MFQFAGFASRGYVFTPRYLPREVGFPIRKSPDQRVLATPRGLSQRATSFIASQCQGIHQMPLSRLIVRNRHAQRSTQTRRSAYGRSPCQRVHAKTQRRSAHDPIRRACRNPVFALCDGVPCILIHDCEEPPAAGQARAESRSCRPDRWKRRSAHDQAGGGERNRTVALLLAKQALSQLSYTPGSDARDQESDLIPDACLLIPDHGGPG